MSWDLVFGGLVVLAEIVMGVWVWSEARLNRSSR